MEVSDGKSNILFKPAQSIQCSSDFRLERIRQESPVDIEFYHSLIQKNAEDKNCYELDNRSDLQEALNVLRKMDYDDENTTAILNSLKELCLVLNCTLKKLENGTFKLENEEISIQIKTCGKNIVNFNVLQCGEKYGCCDVLKNLFVKKLFRELGKSILLLNSSIPKCNEQSKVLQVLTVLERDLLELRRKSFDEAPAKKLTENYGLEFCFPRTEVNPFSIVLFGEPDLLNKFKKAPSNDFIIEHAEKLDFAYICVKKINTLNYFPKKSFLINNAKSDDESLALPFKYCLQFSKPIVLLQSTFKEIESTGCFKCNVLNKINISQYISGCYTDEIKLKCDVIRKNFIQLYELHKFGSDEEDVVVDKIFFLRPTSLVRVLTLLRQQLLFNSLFQNICQFNENKILPKNEDQIENDLKQTKKDKTLLRIRIIPLVSDSSSFKLIAAFKIGGLILSVNVFIKYGILKLRVSSLDKSYKPSTRTLKKWCKCLKKTLSIPFLILTIVHEIEATASCFDNIFLPVLLPIITVNDNEKHLSELDYLFNNSVEDDDKNELQSDKSPNLNKKLCMRPFMSNDSFKYFDDLDLLSEFNKTNVYELGESWLQHYRIFFTTNYKNQEKSFKNEPWIDVSKETSENHSKNLEKNNSNILSDVTKSTALQFNKKFLFKVEHERKGEISLLRSMKYIEEIDELVPRSPPYQNLPYSMYRHHFHHYNHHHHMFNHNQHLHNHYMQNEKMPPHLSHLQNIYPHPHLQMPSGNSSMHNLALNGALMSNNIIMRGTSSTIMADSRNSDDTTPLGLRNTRSNTETSTTTMTLNNAFSDLEALAAMGRDDSESVAGDSNRFSIENLSPTSSNMDSSQDQKSRFQQQNLGTLNQPSTFEDHKLNPNLARLRLMQQQSISGGDVFDFTPESSGLNTNNRQQKLPAENILPYEESFAASSSSRRNSASSTVSRRGNIRSGSANSLTRFVGNSNGKNVVSGSSVDIDSNSGTSTPTRRTRKSRKLSSNSVEQKKSSQSFINPYMSANSSTIGGISLPTTTSFLQGFFSAEKVSANYNALPSEESRRIYEMEMLGDSSDDEETDPPPPRTFEQSAQNQSHLTPQQLQQRNQRAAAAEQQRKFSAAAISTSGKLSIKTSSSISAQNAASARSSGLSDSEPTALTLPKNLNDKPIKISLSPNSLNDDSSKPPALQKLSTDNSNVSSAGSLPKSTFSSNQIKKETPPVLDLYDMELESELKTEREPSPKCNLLQFSRERLLKKDSTSGCSLTNPTRSKDSFVSKTSKESLRRKGSTSSHSNFGGLTNKREALLKSGENSTEPLKFVLKIPKSSTTAKSNQYSSSSSPSSTSSTSNAPTFSGAFSTVTSTALQATLPSVSSAEPVARLSSHAAPPSKSKSMHSRMYSDPANRLSSNSSTSSSTNRKRFNSSALDGSVKKRSKDFSVATNKTSSGSSLASLSNINIQSTKSIKRVPNSASFGSSLSSSFLSTNSGSSMGTAVPLTSTSLSTNTCDITSFPQVSFFPGLRNFKIPKVVETTNETTTSSASNADTNVASTNKSDFVPVAVGLNAGGSSGGSLSGSNNNSRLTENVSNTNSNPSSNRTNFNRNGNNGINNSNESLNLFGGETSSIPSLNIQQQLQRKPNKSILKNSSYGASGLGEGPPRNNSTVHSGAAYRSSTINNSVIGKNRKTLLPTQNSRAPSLQQCQPRAALSGNSYARGEKGGWQGSGINQFAGRDRVAPIEWAPAFSHHQQMASQQQAFQGNLVSSSGGGYGPPPPLLPFSQQSTNQKSQNNNSHPPTLQQQQHAPSQKPESEGDPLSPVEGLLIDEGE